jgi:hypothetical protein
MYANYCVTIIYQKRGRLKRRSEGRVPLQRAGIFESRKATGLLAIHPTANMPMAQIRGRGRWFPGAGRLPAFQPGPAPPRAMC